MAEGSDTGVRSAVPAPVPTPWRPDDALLEVAQHPAGEALPRRRRRSGEVFGEGPPGAVDRSHGGGSVGARRHRLGYTPAASGRVGAGRWVCTRTASWRRAAAGTGSGSPKYGARSTSCTHTDASREAPLTGSSK